jgi:hypothetical protein
MNQLGPRLHDDAFLVRLQHEMNSTASLLRFLYRQHLALQGFNRIWVITSLSNDIGYTE